MRGEGELRAGPCRPGVAGGLARRLAAAERRVPDDNDCTLTMDNSKSQIGATIPPPPIDNRRECSQIDNCFAKQSRLHPARLDGEKDWRLEASPALASNPPFPSPEEHHDHEQKAPVCLPEGPELPHAA